MQATHFVIFTIEVFFDSEYLSYKTIIEFIKHHAETNENAFRIWPKNSNFILGSDSSVSKGEVIHL